MHKTLDANEAVASVAYRLSEVIPIYPITPSSPMAESCDEWASAGRKNLWGAVPRVMELQSEGGAAGTFHGALQAGAMSTTFTASQGLLLMIPVMYKVAGELTPFCMHVTARALATHALSIFGDHSDVMACRSTGFAMLGAGSVQESADFAVISHAATLRTRVPFLHFFDGFRTSHEVAKIEVPEDDVLRALVDEADITGFRDRALTPDHPQLRGTAQNPDVFFQAREASNPFHASVPGVVTALFEQYAELTGRRYSLVDYTGAPDAERVVIVMGSGGETVDETAAALNARGEKVGVLRVRLYRPFPAEELLAALPMTVRAVAVLDRTKEPGALGEPLFLDVVATLSESGRLMPKIIGGRYGLGSKEFTPAMAKAVFDELSKREPKRRFTVGIVDDVTGLSLPVDDSFEIETDDVFRAIFIGLGADGTVGANKNTIKIIGEETENYAQGYFVYDSKKSGAMTVSHLRFGPRPIRAPYLVRQAQFVGCHQFQFVENSNPVDFAAPGAVFLLQSPYAPDQVWDHLPREVQASLVEKRIRFYVINANQVARDSGMGGRINTIMQTCFFAISGVLPREEALEQIKKAVKKTYGRKGEEIVRKNFAAIDQTLAALHEVKLPDSVSATFALPPPIPSEAPEFVQRVTGVILAGKGDALPVSAFPPDGTWPTATTKWEKRNLALEIPVWDTAVCIQCNKCVLVCPHAAIRAKFYAPEDRAGAPETFKSAPFRSQDFPGMQYTLQVAAEDCTGCSLCVAVCPAKDRANPRHKAINMAEQLPLRDAERKNYDFFLALPEPDRTKIRLEVKGTQFLTPLFEYSGACAGCGETPYLKLLTQLFGDRLLIANATGCSSIYGGNLPTTPYCTDSNGRGPAWSNSLFEDNAEFGLGMRLALDKHRDQASDLLRHVAPVLGDTVVKELLEADQRTEAGIFAQRARVAELKAVLARHGGVDAQRALVFADYLVRKSVWIVGGDGWAYDIGYGGLDHVIATGQDVNILVLDTQVYSNTGGQQSKATPLSAVAKFAADGKGRSRKMLGPIAMTYRDVYVASVAMGAKDGQTVQALQEAESYNGPSLVIAYSHCIAHGYNLTLGMEQQKLAVDTGFWPLLRYDPRRAERGQPALQLDSAAPKQDLSKFLQNETRFRMLEKVKPERARELAHLAQADATAQYSYLERLAKSYAGEVQPAAPAPAAVTPETKS